MQPPPHRGVPNPEHDASKESASKHSASNADWEAVHTFLEVVRRGSFRSASDHLGLSINALRRRIADLESQLGVMLLTRHVDGVRTTAEGAEIYAAALKMELASFGLIRARDRSVPSSLSGEVKIAITEGLGTFWLAPRLTEFQRAHPKLLVDLRCAMQSADVLRLEADAAIQLTKPQNPDVKIVKLGRLHSMPFAGQSYIDTYGVPTTVEELFKHRVVLQIAEQTAMQEHYERIAAGVPQLGFVAMRTNVSSALLWAVAKGAGIGWLPTYVPALAARVVPVELDLRFGFDIWLTYHPDVTRIPRVRRMIDWTIEAFDPKRFPWFRDEFIHPKDLPKAYRGAPIVNLFEGFFGFGDNPIPSEGSRATRSAKR